MLAGDKNYKSLVKIIENKTGMGKYTSMAELNRKESSIKYKKMYHGNAKFNDSYFKLATGHVLDMYRK